MRTATAAAWISLLAMTIAASACGKGGESGDANDAEKKAHEAATSDLKQPIALISAYLPYASYPKDEDKYFPKRHSDLDQSTLTAANEVRFAANKARQTLETSSANATKDLQESFKQVTIACQDADDPDKLDKCNASVKALDGAIEKTQAAATALGVTAKYPRIGPESVTPEAKDTLSTFMKAKGPSANDEAFTKKRNDPAATPQDVETACQAAAQDASTAASTYDKAEEPIRLIAVKRKMSMDSQCHQLEALDGLQKDVRECKKKPKNNVDCKITCGKAKGALEDGVPAAALASLQDDFKDICDKR